jgi:integrase
MIEEPVGWASEGMNEDKANKKRADLKENQRERTGPRTLKEEKDLADTERQRQEAQRVQEVELEKQEAMARLTFLEIFQTKYLPHTQANRRNPRSWKSEESLFRLWVSPIIGGKPLSDIAPIHLEKIKKDMAKAGRAGRSIIYALAVIRQVFNYATTNDLYSGKNPAGPAGKVKRPVTDNKRLRYLSREEAPALLTEITAISRDVHDMALLSLHTGMRAGEVFSLTWADVDLSGGVLQLKDTKSNKNRPAFMTESVKAMLQARTKSAPAALVFPGRNGKKIVQASDTFTRAVDKLGLNEGIIDRRQRVTFHTLRHTFASWLVESGTDIYTVQELLGHSDLKLTARYAHIGENSMRAAVQRLEVAG